MYTNEGSDSLETLREIRNIMDKSTRFISLSGMSGIWAGAIGFAGAVTAYSWLVDFHAAQQAGLDTGPHLFSITNRLILLALGVLFVAISGAYYFTARKAKKNNQKMWSHASRQMIISAFFPLFAGGAFCLAFVFYGFYLFIGPACLMFYGLALISGSRHTLSDIQYLGMLNLALGVINLFYPGYDLYFWAAGFGLFNILYGAVMWKKYDN